MATSVYRARLERGVCVDGCGRATDTPRCPECQARREALWQERYEAGTCRNCKHPRLPETPWCPAHQAAREKYLASRGKRP